MNANEILNDKARLLKQGAIRAMFDRANNMENTISMGIGEPDLDTPQPICDACVEALQKGYTHYTPNAGLPLLRKAISEYGLAISGLYDPNKEIIVTNGGMGALSLLMQVILNEGDEVLLPDPAWLNYVAQIQYCGGMAIPIPTSAENHFVPQVCDIEQKITSRTKAIIINCPNNPTGEVIPVEDLKKISALAQKYDLLVISDEVYGTLIYEDAKAVSISSLPGMKERTVVINSFSKSFAMTGWRIGFAAGPEPIINRMSKVQENFNSCANAPGQYAASVALQHPELAVEIRDSFSERRDITLDALNRIPGMVCNRPMGAFYAFPDISAFGLDSKTFCNRLLEEKGVVCIPGSAFGPSGEGHIRISYTTEMGQLQEALSRLAEFCASYYKEGATA